MGVDICCQICFNNKSEEINLNCFSCFNTNHNINRVHRIVNINCCSCFNSNLNFGMDEEKDTDRNIIPIINDGLLDVKIIFCHINLENIKILVPVSYFNTIDKLLRKYMETIRLNVLINTDYIKFSYKNKPLKFGDSSNIRQFFGNDSRNEFEVKVIVPLSPINQS